MASGKTVIVAGPSKGAQVDLMSPIAPASDSTDAQRSRSDCAGARYATRATSGQYQSIIDIAYAGSAFLGDGSQPKTNHNGDQLLPCFRHAPWSRTNRGSGSLPRFSQPALVRLHRLRVDKKFWLSGSQFIARIYMRYSNAGGP